MRMVGLQDLTGRGRGLRAISALNGVTLIITLLITYNQLTKAPAPSSRGVYEGL